MPAPAKKFPRRPIRLVGILLALFSVAASAAFLDEITNSKISFDDVAISTATASKTSNPGTTKCSNCGRIESVREIATSDPETRAAVVSGTRVGGAAGNQTGPGRSQDWVTVGGAVGADVVGNRIERRAKSDKNYRIVVRLDDGSAQTIHETHTPMWRAGDRVSVNNGTIQSTQ